MQIFARIGRFSARFRWPVIVAWFTLTAIVWSIAPNFDDVASSNTADFLPSGAPFAQGENLMAEIFPNANPKSSAVLVLEVPGGDVRAEPTWGYIVSLTAWLQSDAAPEQIAGVISPGSDIPLIADSMIAPDNKLAILMVNLDSGMLDEETQLALEEVLAYSARTAPPGVNTYLTGNGPIINSYATSAVTSVERTLGVTIVLVISLLLLIYRSPVSPLVPLITVSASYLISRGIVAWIGAHYMTVTTYANMLLVVVLFGAGTDYCLFLISRFREEVADDSDVEASAVRTVHRVGETITSSAGTVFVGFVAMSFAEMGLFATTGPSLAIGVVVVLSAGLTLTPALLSVLGERAFWPGKASHRAVGRVYERISAFVSDHPFRAILGIILVLGPFAVYAAVQATSTYNMLADLPDDNLARRGFQVLETHMGAGQIQPVDVVLPSLDPETALAEVDYWTERLLAIEGVADVRGVTAPLGRENEMLRGLARIDHQLGLAAELLASFNQETLKAQLTPENLQLALSALPFVHEYLDALETNYPEMAGNEDLTAIHRTVSGLPVVAISGNLAGSLADLQTHLQALSEAFAGIDNAYYLPDALPEPLVAALGLEEDPLAALTSRYILPDRAAAHLEVILAVNPFGDEVPAIVRELRQTLPDGENVVSGYPAMITDLNDTMDRDMLRAFSLVLLGIFFVLLFLLRGLVSPVYLILTILLSYGATMGITSLFSELIFGIGALTWWVPFFMFVMLVALGMDYNIFLMGRVKEETGGYGMREGVHRAVAATGPIITSAGLIMAGTFAAMMAGEITGLKQLGFAVAVGVMIDTFIIRTALVPAIAVLLGKWNWWPGKPPRPVGAPELPDRVVPGPVHGD